MRPKILFVHSSSETFVRLDCELLRSSFDVQDFCVYQKFPSGAIQYFENIKNSDLVFCWFASWNSFWALLLAKIMRKGSVLVIGGYDLAKLPEANYGHQRGGLGKWISRLAMKLATVLFTNSFFSQKEAEHNAGVPSQRIRVIYHGVPDPYGSVSKIPKERMALTVGKVDSSNLKRKGLKAFVQTAAYLPDIQFVLVGDWADISIEHLRSIAPGNVRFAGYVSDEELLDYYRRASVYVQASLHEGFGLSVAEAMLAGCIPVISRAGSLPEVVGDCGFFSNSPEPQDIAGAITMALSSSYSLRKQARERILSHFSMQQRGQLLKELVESVWNNDDAKN